MAIFKYIDNVVEHFFQLLQNIFIIVKKINFHFFFFSELFVSLRLASWQLFMVMTLDADELPSSMAH